MAAQSQKRHMWSWLANHQLIQHPRKMLQSRHLHETWRHVMQPILSLLHDAIMSHFQLRVDLNLRPGGLYSPLSCHYVNFFPSSARDCGGFDWLLVGFVGIWLNDKRRKDFFYIYIYLYIVWKKGKVGKEDIYKNNNLKKVTNTASVKKI